MVLYWTGSHSSVRFLDCGTTTVLLPNKSISREVHRLRAVPLQSVKSKLGRTGESELAERETAERREEEGLHSLL